MKKIKILLLISILMLFPILVNAESKYDYIAIVKNEVTTSDGTKIPSGTKLEVRYEEIDEEGNINAKVDYKDKSYQVKLNSLKADSINLENYTETNDKFYIYEEGAKLYKGPSTLFDTITNIGKNTSLKAIYYNTSYSWVYVEYNSVKGWLFVGDSNKKIKNLTAIQEETKVITFQKTILTTDTGKEITIPASVELTSDYYINTISTSDFVTKHHVTYNGVSGFIKNIFIENKEALYNGCTYAISNEEMGITLKDATIYSDIKQTKAVTKVSGNSKIIKLYEIPYYNSVYYINDGNNKGWIEYDENNNNIVFEQAVVKNYKLKKDFNLYYLPNGTSENKVLPSGTVIELKYLYINSKNNDNWVYVEKDNSWIEIDYKSLEETEEPITLEKITQKENAKEKNNLVLYLIIGGGTLIVASAITVFLIYKKKSKKVEEQKVEEQNNI